MKRTKTALKFIVLSASLVWVSCADPSNNDNERQSTSLPETNLPEAAEQIEDRALNDVDDSQSAVVLHTSLEALRDDLSPSNPLARDDRYRNVEVQFTPTLLGVRASNRGDQISLRIGTSAEYQEYTNARSAIDNLHPLTESDVPDYRELGRRNHEIAIERIRAQSELMKMRLIIPIATHFREWAASLQPGQQITIRCGSVRFYSSLSFDDCRPILEVSH